MESEILVNLRPKSDYEKLLFATQYINELKKSLRLERIERGKLQSEIDDLIYKLNSIETSQQQLDDRKARVEARKDELYKTMSKQIKNLENEISKLRRFRDELIYKLSSKARVEN